MHYAEFMVNKDRETGVVWFGESLPDLAWRSACEAAKH
jgi:hypothetical protein